MELTGRYLLYADMQRIADLYNDLELGDSWSNADVVSLMRSPRFRMGRVYEEDDELIGYSLTRSLGEVMHLDYLGLRRDESFGDVLRFIFDDLSRIGRGSSRSSLRLASRVVSDLNLDDLGTYGFCWKDAQMSRDISKSL